MTTATQRKIPRKVPEYLVKEVLDGIPIYYKGYKSVLRKEKDLESIMGASGLQIFIIKYFTYLLVRELKEETYFFFTGEGGMHIDTGNNLSGDVMIYEKSKLPVSKIDVHYLDLPPKINIEIDVNIDHSFFTENTYITRKTERLLAFGVEKVIWVLTKSKKVIIAEPNKDWLFVDWTKDIEITDGIIFNMAKYLEKEGITISSIKQ